MADNEKKNTYTPAQARAIKKYTSEKVDRIVLWTPRGMKQEVQDAAKAAGTSVNQYCIDAIRDRMGQQGAGETTL